MDDIQDIVNSIVRGCSHGGQEVSEILAAFVAKTVSEKLFNICFSVSFVSFTVPWYRWSKKTLEPLL